METNLHQIFKRPEFLWLLLLLVPMFVWYFLKEKDSKATIKLSSLNSIRNLGNSFWYKIRHFLFVLRILSISLLILALARPIKVLKNTNKITKGLDIVMSIDISTSMLAQDFNPNRLEVAKKVAINFIKDRPDDRIGIVAFAGESFTVCPLTSDHATAINLLNNLQTGMVEDGTAIGLGLSNAVARLYKSKAKSKVIILLTDGDNNAGEISPMDAALLAKNYGIRVYTIGIGSRGKALIPVNTPAGIQMQQMDVKINENLLTQIADTTGGKYFRATDEKKLRDIYNEIDKLEKTIFEAHKDYVTKEFYEPFLITALILILLELAFRITIYRTIP